MGKSATNVGMATALAVCGSWQAAKVFVPMVTGASTEVAPALSGASMSSNYNKQAEGRFNMPSTTAGALALTAAVGMASRHSRSSQTRRAAAAAAPSADEEAPETPPPPPPFDPAAQFGATAPLGFFDPLGFCKKGDEQGFRNFRSAELKHGRVAMMAAVGAVVQHFVQFPGFENVPKGLGAVTTPPGVFGFAALFAVSGLLEVVLWKDDPTKDVSSIGDFGNPLQLGVGQPLGESEDMKNRELNNGRAAMFAALGIIVAELVTGKDAVQQLS